MNISAMIIKYKSWKWTDLALKIGDLVVGFDELVLLPK